MIQDANGSDAASNFVVGDVDLVAERRRAGIIGWTGRPGMQ